MSLSTDYALRTGAFDHTGAAPADPAEAKAAAQQRYDAARGGRPERLATGAGWVGSAWVVMAPVGRVSCALRSDSTPLDTAGAASVRRYPPELPPLLPVPSSSPTGSDDFTLFLWEPSTQKQPLARMTGHMQLINQVHHR